MGHRKLIARSLLLFIVVALVAPRLAVAQQAGVEGFRTEDFRPVASQHSGLLNLRRPDVLNHMVPSVGLFGHYSHRPVEASNVEVEGFEPATIDRRITTEVGAALGLFDLLQISMAVPLVPYQTGDRLGDHGSAGPTGSIALADSRLGLDVVILKPSWTGGFGVSASGILHLPNYNRDDFLSDGAYRVEPNLALNYMWPQGHEIVANISTELGSPVESARYHYSDGGTLRAGLGGALHIGRTSLDVIGSVFGSNSMEDFVVSPTGRRVANSARLLEALGGVRLDLPAGFRLQVGGGFGITDGIGVPDGRLFTSVHWINDPTGQRSASGPRYTYTPGPTEVDADDDGIVDEVDQCPNQPEDPDGFQDDDGCPDVDRDGDGIPDRKDRCPETAGRAERDGCPGYDSDEDGVIDENDACPNEAEDRDGFEDDDGCPDPDNDDDGFPDVDDQCPDRPEDIDGDRDRDGCPDGAQAAQVDGDRIRINQNIQFESGESTLRPASHAILDKVADILSNNDQIEVLRIEGYTDSRGAADYNRRLSRRRAESVKSYLVEQGIDADRLEAVGRGESDPIASNETAEGRSKNRRVEFHIDRRE